MSGHKVMRERVGAVEVSGHEALAMPGEINRRGLVSAVRRRSESGRSVGRAVGRAGGLVGLENGERSWMPCGAKQS